MAATAATTATATEWIVGGEERVRARHCHQHSCTRASMIAARSAQECVAAAHTAVPTSRMMMVTARSTRVRGTVTRHRHLPPGCHPPVGCCQSHEQLPPRHMAVGDPGERERKSSKTQDITSPRIALSPPAHKDDDGGHWSAPWHLIRCHGADHGCQGSGRGNYWGAAGDVRGAAWVCQGSGLGMSGERPGYVRVMMMN